MGEQLPRRGGWPVDGESSRACVHTGVACGLLLLHLFLKDLIGLVCTNMYF